MTSPDYFTLFLDDQAVDFEVPNTPTLTVATGSPTDVITTIVEDDQAISLSVDYPTVDVTTLSEPFAVVTLEGPAGVQGIQGEQGIQGLQGLPGADGTGTRVTGEEPSGTKNGTNPVFTLANSYQLNSTAVYRNGLREMQNVGYVETAPNEITFSDAPLVDDDIMCDYLVLPE
jgi:hypothetical protein